MIDDALIEDLDINPTLDSMKMLLGYDKALKLSCDFGGKRIEIPYKVGEHAPLAESIGLDAAKKIAHVYGGMRFYVPVTAKKKQRILDMSQDGVSASKIAEALYCSERYVRKVRRQNRAQRDQLTLF